MSNTLAQVISIAPDSSVKRHHDPLPVQVAETKFLDFDMAEIIGLVTGLIGGCDVVLRASTTVIKYISDVRNAPEDMKKVQAELENLGAIVSAVKGFLSSPKVSQHTFKEDAPIAKAIDDCGRLVSKLQSDAERDMQRGRMRWAFGSRERYREILSELDRLTTMFHLALSLDGWNLFFQSSDKAAEQLKGIQKDLQRVIDIIRPMENMRNDVKEWESQIESINEALKLCAEASSNNKITAALSRMEETLQRQEREQTQQQQAGEQKELLDFVSDADLDAKHSDMIKIRHPNTGSWILDDSAFQDWIQGRSVPTLWGSGIPGCGKTIIFSTIVEHLRKQQKSPNSVVLATYLTYQDPVLQGVDAIFQAILRYTAQTIWSDNLRSLLIELRQHCQVPHPRLPSALECLGLLRKLADSGNEIILCFDGVDELSEKSQRILLNLLSELNMVPNFKIFMMSRPNLDMRLLIHHEVTISAKESDLHLFVKSEVENILRTITDDSKTLVDSLCNKITAQVIDKSNGMFLLANLQVRQLEGASSPRDMVEMSHDLPESVDDQFHAYLKRLEAHPRSKLALTALKWVSCAYRPLSGEEFLEALAIRPNDSDRDPSGTVSLEMVLQAAGGLLVFDRISNIVRLVHESFLEYLQRTDVDLLTGFHLHILEILATYINFETFRQMGDAISDNWVKFAMLQDSYGLLEYSCSHWHHHLQLASNRGSSLGLRIVNSLAESPSLLRFAAPIRQRRFLLTDAPGFTPLHVSVLYAATSVVHLILKGDPTTINSQSRRGHTALHVSVISEDTSCTDLLLANDADPHIQDLRGRTAVHVAARCDSLAALQDILAAIQIRGDATTKAIDAVDMDGKTPLHMALLECNTNCVRELLKHGANISTATSTGQTPIHYAVQFCTGVVADLIKAGGPLLALSNNGRSALHWACIRGIVVTSVRNALQGLDPNLTDKENATPLHVLCMNKKVDLTTVKWLMDMGADPNVQDNEGMTPLHCALSNQSYALADYLLDRGAQTELENRDGALPVFLAAGSNDCPRELLKRLLYTNSLRQHAEPLLHRVVRRQKADEVFGLLSIGADVTATNDKGETALHLAIQLSSPRARHSTMHKMRSDIVSLVLYNGADPHARSKAGLTPCHIALIRGSLPIVTLLTQEQFLRGFERSTCMPNGITINEFSLFQCPAPCFERVILAGSYAPHFDVLPDLLVAIITHMLLFGTASDVVSNNYKEATAKFMKDLGLPVASSVGLRHEACSLDGRHNMTCDELHDICAKIVFLATSELTQLATHPMIKDNLEHWWPWWSRLLLLPDHSKLLDIAVEYRNPHRAAELSTTPCRQAAVDAFCALKWPGHFTSMANQSSLGGYVWEDTLPLSYDGSTLHTQADGSLESHARYRAKSLADPIMVRDARRPTLAGPRRLSKKDISAYESNRRHKSSRWRPQALQSWAPGGLTRSHRQLDKVAEADERQQQ